MRRYLLLLTFFATAAACGSRTALLFPDEEDASVDAGHDAHVADVNPPPRFDGGFDAPEDTLPPIDVFHRDVAPPNDCPDAGATLVYVLTSQNELFSFYPPTATFKRIGNIACPSFGATPFSMAVDRKGTAYSVFTDGNLFRLSTATAACLATPFAVGQDGFSTFGMGYVADVTDGGDTLFIAGSDFTGTPSRGLATIDTTSFALRPIGAFPPNVPGAELTGTGDGRLFGFYTNRAGTGSHVIQIDKATGNVVADSPLRVGDPSDAYAFAFWGGDFWIFTAPSGPTQVTRFRPSDGSETTITTMPSTIVGAGVSTCAPQ